MWRAEEPYRFMQGRVGSLIYAGKLTVADLVPRGAPFDVAEWLRDEELQPRRAAGRTLISLLELHIEQGKRLEDAGIAIGVVTAISGTTRLHIRLTGIADHSGATPMHLRHDALSAAAEIVLATERAGRDELLPESVATAAILTVTPGAMNVVPGGAELFLDIRSTDVTSVARMVDAITDATTTIGQRRGVTVEVITLTRATPMALEPAMIACVETSAQALGYSTMQMASGAGHDAQSVADYTPVGMIFVPSRGGISHAPQEYTAPDAILRGVRTLASAWMRVASSMQWRHHAYRSFAARMRCHRHAVQVFLADNEGSAPKLPPEVKSMTILRGTWYIAPTAFQPDGSVDLDSQRRLIDAAISWGVDGLTVLGVMGEANTLSDNERRAVLAAIRDATAGRVPIAVGCTASSTRGQLP